MSSVINGYDAILVKGQPRFRLDRKMVAAANVPAEIRAVLTAEVSQPTVKEIQPSPADIQKTAESVPIEAGVAPLVEPVVEGSPLDEVDFIDEPVASPQEKRSLNSLAEELYARFGVYTVFAGSYPQVGDIHPFTSKPMNQYQTGMAYRAYSGLVTSGNIERDFSQEYDQVQAGRLAEVAHAEEVQRRRENPNFDQPKWQSFSDRTSVAGQNRQSSTTTVTRPNDPISEDVTAEPNVRGTTIRPEW